MSALAAAVRRLATAAALVACASSAFAEIRFRDVTEAAGIHRVGQSKGAAWGDFDGDGDPDLWLSNRYDPPALYVNEGEGGFVDRSGVIVSEVPEGYGALWCDVDGDGRLDLVSAGPGQHGGAGGPGRANTVLVNRGGKLIDAARELGVAHRSGRGRTPLCVDLGGDGRPDLLVTAMKRADGSAAVALENRDGEGFVDVTGRAGLSSEGSAFAAVTRLGPGTDPLLLLHGWPMHLYRLGGLPLEPVGAHVALPVAYSQDAALADLDGDARTDLVLVHADLWGSGVERVGERRLLVALGSPDSSERRVRFRADGPIEVRVQGSFLEPDGVALGKRGHAPRRLVFELDPERGRFSGVPARAAGDPTLRMGFRRGIGFWEIAYAHSNPRWLAIEAAGGIGEVRAGGLLGARGEGLARLYLGGEEGFREGPAVPMPCHSAASGDLDNDGDLDLYLVCAGPVSNRPNRVLANVGEGRFEAVPDAAGAAGSALGRGESVALADHDLDGDLDVLVTNGEGYAPFNEGPVQLFENVGATGHWLEIDLVGRAPATDAVGAQAVLRTGERVQVRTVGANVHRYSQSHARLHFGLGAAERVERLTLHWPGGATEVLEDLPVDRLLRLEEPAPGATGER